MGNHRELMRRTRKKSHGWWLSWSCQVLDFTRTYPLLNMAKLFVSIKKLTLQRLIEKKFICSSAMYLTGEREVFVDDAHQNHPFRAYYNPLLPLGLIDLISIQMYGSSRPTSGALQCEGVPWTADFYLARADVVALWECMTKMISIGRSMVEVNALRMLPNRLRGPRLPAGGSMRTLRSAFTSTNRNHHRLLPLKSLQSKKSLPFVFWYQKTCFTREEP